MHSPSSLRTLVEESLAHLPYPPQPAQLYEPVRYALTLGGKRLRPVMMLMAYELWQDHPEDILPQALAMEVYHNFTLLHDDVMDHATVRRGKPCVHVKWEENTAILAGDAMLVLAYKLFGCPLIEASDGAQTDAARSTFDEATLGVCEGQQYDMDFEQATHVTEDDYMEMIRLKTSLLFSCSLKIGAQLAGAPADEAQHLYHFGRLLGLAFQLQDDWLDVYADPAQFGKQTGGDICENKRTWLLIETLRLANDTQRETLDEWLKMKDFDREEKIAAVTRLYNELGVGDRCQQRVNQLFAEALDQLEAVDLPADRKAPLHQLALRIMGRQA